MEDDEQALWYEQMQEEELARQQALDEQEYWNRRWAEENL